ncbi:MAG: acetate--CoA ligase family protein [Burkholderiaceae bacterium]
MMADAAQAAGLAMNPVSARAAARIRAVLPLASTANPVDATAQMSANPEVLGELLDALMSDDANDVVCMMIALALEVPRLREAYLNTLRSITSRYPDRCLVACVSQPPDAIRLLAEMGVACFPTIDAMFGGIAAMARASNPGAAPDPVPAPPPAVLLDRSTFFNEREAKRVLRAAGIPSLAEHLVTSPAEAASITESIDGPVAMKIVSPDIQHKSDVGGVALGVEGAAAAVKAYEAIIAAVGVAAPRARLEGVLVSPMMTGGVELILGISRDPLFGPMVMVGLGGIHAEVFRDTALRPAPVSESEASAMLRELKCFPLLDGARGRPRSDVGAAARAIAALSVFALAHADQVAEIDINPLLVLTEGVVALDALIVPRSDGGKEDNA